VLSASPPAAGRHELAIENYLGFPAGISGVELTRNALLQAQRFGARIDIREPSSVSDRRGRSRADAGGRQSSARAAS
jgi:thioredoxin reductase (NADPH)